MSSINNNGLINKSANSNVSEVKSTKKSGKFGKNKVSIFKRIRNFINKKFNLSKKKNTNKDLLSRAINTQVLKNHLQQKQKFSSVNDYADTESYSSDSASDHRLTEIKDSSDEPIYVNLQKDSNEDHVYENIDNLFSSIDEDYVNIDALRNQPKNDISQSSLEAINNDIQSLENHLDDIKSSSFGNQELSDDTYEKFQEINAQSPKFKSKPEKTFRADNKYSDIPCPKHSSATAGNIYHANNIDMEFGNYVAAQGPYTNYQHAAVKKVSENTSYNFIAMLAEKQSPISVSLVKDNEFNKNGRNNYLPPPVGETLKIPEIKSQGKVIREKVTIKKLDSIYNKDAKLQTDIFSINGKTHIRVYDLDWEDKTGGDPVRLSAISVFVEKLRSLPEVIDRKDNPVTVNCNAGVGRTGTFIMINNMTRRYLEGSGTHNIQDVVSDIKGARQSRPMMVQKAQQLETLKTVSGNSIDLFKPIAEKLNIDKESLYNR